jgi:5'-methylthioadenosine phosphorylase
MAESPTLAVIGGSGLYAMEGMTDIHEHDLMTPFGKASDSIVVGTLDGKPIAFLARHGRGHRHTPSEVNYRANVFALKLLGVERIVSISACGSLREDYRPGDIVVPDQLFDLTRDRPRTFFGRGLVAHVGTADPFCPDLSKAVADAVRASGARVHDSGSLITVEGPRFSTKAESNTFRQWGMAIIGMTTSPEAFLAREAEMCYAVMAHVTDYDVWHVSEAPVTVEMVVRILNQNTSMATAAVRRLATSLPMQRTCDCPHALSSAIITARDAIPPAVLRDLEPLVGKYLSADN